MSEPSSRRSRRLARIGLGLVAAVALTEWIASAFVYRQAIAPDDWAAASIAVGQLPPEEPVWLGTAWLGPRARLHLPRLSRWDAVAPPDLRGAARFHVIGRPGDEWSRELAADLEDLPAPVLVQTTELGGLTLSTYEQPAAGVVRGSFVDEASRLEVESEGGRCRGQERRTCSDGRVGVAAVEIDYRTRRCLKAELQDGARVRLHYPGMTTGDVLRGHVGFDDFNARLRSDAPVRVRLSLDGERVAQWLVTDEQGWWPFAVSTSPGVHDVTLELSAAVAGTWQREGYDAGRPHAACVELRALQEGST